MRTVSSNKEMFRATFRLPAEYAYHSREAQSEQTGGSEGSDGAGGERNEESEVLAKRFKHA